jgi:uncharacterized cupredoxin-like copper-binding protein
MYRRASLLVALIVSVSVLFIGCGGSKGGSSGGSSSARTIDVDMKDIAYAPTSVDVKVGQPVKFVFHNKGATQHDAFIGDEAAQDDHEKEMRGTGRMGHKGATDAITVKPGKAGSITRTFDTAGPVLIGCHEPGHYAGGMKLQVNIT